MENRRQYPRIDVRLPVILRYDGRLIPATALNISCGGMLLTTDGGDVTRNAPVEVIVDLSEEERDVALRGDVVRIGSETPAQVGIQFTNLYALGLQALERFLKRQERQ